MINEFDRLDKQRVTKMRGGEGEVIIEKMMPLLAHMKMYARITIPQGSSIGSHTHVGDEEVIYVLKGKGFLTTADKEETISQGMVNITKENENHQIRNPFVEDLILLAIINEI